MRSTVAHVTLVISTVIVTFGAIHDFPVLIGVITTAEVGQLEVIAADRQRRVVTRDALVVDDDVASRSSADDRASLGKHVQARTAVIYNENEPWSLGNIRRSGP